MKNGLGLVLVIGLGCTLAVVAPSASTSSNLDTIVSVVFGHVSTLDPAYAWDSSSKAIIMNVYEGLIRSSLITCDRTGCYSSGSATTFWPVLATLVPTRENGNIRDGGLTYYFPIRDDVYFHSGSKLTAEDVKYTYDRAMVIGRYYGGEAEVLSEVLDSVEVSGQAVVFRLKEPRADFLSMLAQDGLSFNHIIEKKWAEELGDDPEKWKTADPAQSPLHHQANGTGPFKVETWVPGQEIRLVANDSYRLGPPRLKRYVRWEIDCPARRTQVTLGGNADIADIPIEMLPQFEARDDFAVLRDLKVMAMYPVVFFNAEINAENNDLIGCARLDQCGIPPEFFVDRRVRGAFAYIFDYEKYTKAALHGFVEGRGSEAAVGPIPSLLEPYYNKYQERFRYGKEEAIEYLKRIAPLWDTGFRFTIPYIKGNELHKAIAEIFKENIEGVNNKFHIDLKEVEQRDYTRYLWDRKIPLFISGWIADYPDPDNFVRPFMHSKGLFMRLQGPVFGSYQDSVDDLIERARSTTDVKERIQIYAQLQQFAYEWVIQIYLPQKTEVRVIRTNVHELPWNPLLIEFWIYYTTYKE